MTNRVDELEGQVAELRAAVNGLTEELVETKARVRELEDEADAEPTEVDKAESSGTRTQTDDHVTVVEHDNGDVDVAVASETADEPADEPAEEPEADATEPEETTADDSDIETDDIIVA
jgi:chromosome segregation ATPase